MKWRAPWLRQRLGMAVLTGWDCCSLYLFYRLVYSYKVGSWGGVNGGLLVMMIAWVGLSYILGRYSQESAERYEPIKISVRIGVVYGIVLGLFVMHSWAYQIYDAATRYRGFLAIVLSLTSASSLTANLAAAVAYNRKTRIQWVILCRDDEIETVRRCLGESSVELIGLSGDGDSIAAEERVRESLLHGKRKIAVSHKASDMKGMGEFALITRANGSRVISLESWFEEKLQLIPPELVRDNWVIDDEGFKLHPGTITWRIKRMGDLVGALLLLVLTAPIVVVAAFAVWQEDKGPIVYRQKRSGIYGQPFMVYKLRSMKIDAEKEGIMWAGRNDRRVTNTGRVIRATRIDELPQLLNVIRGEMSLIGPRPERPEIEDDLRKAIPFYGLRSCIRPGLSGWAQVCYPYGASLLDSRNKLSYDIYYLKNAGLLIDILIVIKTVRLVINAKGATPKEYPGAA